MIVQVHLRPTTAAATVAGGHDDWKLYLPDMPVPPQGLMSHTTTTTTTTTELEDWVWEHGRDQILKRLVFTTLAKSTTTTTSQTFYPFGKNPPQSDSARLKDDEGTGANKEQGKTKNYKKHDAPSLDKPTTKQIMGTSAKVVVTDDQPQTEAQQNLDLCDKLCTVQSDYLCGLQELEAKNKDEMGHSSKSEEEENATKTMEKLSQTAMSQFLDVLLQWTESDYGIVASVKEESSSSGRQPTQRRKSMLMNDISELDISEMEQQEQERMQQQQQLIQQQQKPWSLRLGEQLAKFHVPTYSDGKIIDDDDSDSDSEEEVSLGDSDLNESDQYNRKFQQTSIPLPITTYGPVEYKGIRGSLTLLRDQLRFEPFDPEEKVPQHDDAHDDDSSSGNVYSTRNEYNYMEVEWEKVEKYQLTPRKSKTHHLFKLIYRKKHFGPPRIPSRSSLPPSLSFSSSNSSDRTFEIIFKMKSRLELERIAQDVKRRVVLPSRNPKPAQDEDHNNNSTTIPGFTESDTREQQRRRRRRFRRYHSHDSGQEKIQQQVEQNHQSDHFVGSSHSAGTGVMTDGSNSSQWSARERAVLLPPPKPRRTTSDGSMNDMRIDLGYDTDRDSRRKEIDNQCKDISPALLRPTRRPTANVTDNAFDLSFVSHVESDSFNDDANPATENESAHDLILYDRFIPEDAIDGTQAESLWSIDDVLEKCRQSKATVLWKGQKRSKRPELTTPEGANNDAEEGVGENIDLGYEDVSEARTIPDDEEEKIDIALLPREWRWLMAIPILDLKGEKVKFILILAGKSKGKEIPLFPKILKAHRRMWWITTVTRCFMSLAQQRDDAGNIAKLSQKVKDLEAKLRESLLRHSDMIHSILPPSAVRKLKLQPQEWKGPLTHIHRQLMPPKPTEIPVISSGVSYNDDSTITGSFSSRLLSGASGSAVDSTSTLFSVPESKDDHAGEKNRKVPKQSTSGKAAQPKQNSSSSTRPVPKRTNSSGNINLAMRALQQQGTSATTRPVFSRADSTRGMMMARANSARNMALLRRDSSRRVGLVKMDSSQFGRAGLLRINSLKSMAGQTVTSASAQTLDQSWRTMYADEDSIHPDDLSRSQASVVSRLGALSSDVSLLTAESTVRYINGGALGNITDVEALYASTSVRVSIVAVSIGGFSALVAKLKAEQIMDILAKLMFIVDRLCERHRTIKVEMVGSVVLIMSGLFTGVNDEDKKNLGLEEGDTEHFRNKNAAMAAMAMAKDFISEAQTIKLPKEFQTSGAESSEQLSKKIESETLTVRAGIHVGAVVYGVLGQNVPKLTCIGESIRIALKLQDHAPDNCIRASKAFHDLLGADERGWDDQSSTIEIPISISDEGNDAAASMLFSAAALPDFHSYDASIPAPMRSQKLATFSLEPPPPAISSTMSIASSSHPSATSTMGNSQGLYGPDRDDSLLGPVDTSFSELSFSASALAMGASNLGGSFLSTQHEESFVSGDFTVD